MYKMYIAVHMIRSEVTCNLREHNFGIPGGMVIYNVHYV